MSALFSSIKLRDTLLPNRIIVSPMCQYSAVEGSANSWHEIHLGGLALSGAAVLFTEATAISAEGRITPGDLGIYSEDNIVALRNMLQGIRHNAHILLGMQLAHAGRKASSQAPWEGGLLIAPKDGGWLPLAPSALPHGPDEAPPKAMTLNDLEKVKQDFVKAAEAAVALGFDMLELHCAHGYLLHQFLSPVANHRQDQYGGTLENRMRFPLEVLRAVRAAVPESLPVGVRVSSTDWLEHLGTPSWRLEDTIAFSVAAEAAGADWIDASSGGISPLQKISVGPSYQVPFAAAIKKNVSIPVFAVGMITEPKQAEQIVASHEADCVALARAMLYDPRWPWHAAKELGGVLEGPKQYWRSLPAGSGRIFGDIKVGQR